MRVARVQTCKILCLPQNLPVNIQSINRPWSAIFARNQKQVQPGSADFTLKPPDAQEKEPKKNKRMKSEGQNVPCLKLPSISRPVIRAVLKNEGKSRVEEATSAKPKGSIGGIQPLQANFESRLEFQHSTVRYSSLQYKTTRSRDEAQDYRAKSISQPTTPSSAPVYSRAFCPMHCLYRSFNIPVLSTRRTTKGTLDGKSLLRASLKQQNVAPEGETSNPRKRQGHSTKQAGMRNTYLELIREPSIRTQASCTA